MAFQCGFFNSVNGDRKYTAEQMNNPYKGIVSNGILAKTDDSNAFQVLSVTGLDIVIKEGFGIFADKWAILDADLPMTIPTPNVSYSRIDSVIVRVDISESVRAGTIEYVQGTASEVPAPPTLTRDSTITEYRLANIEVAPNAISITQANIEDTRPTSECGFVTNLLQDSDITATYRQWQAQFEEWLADNDEWEQNKRAEHENFVETEQAEYNEWTAEKKVIFERWFNNLTETLGVNTVLQSYSNHYETTEENETNIPIGIFDYTSNLDVLEVFINGLKLIPLVDYTVNDFTSITLTKPVDVGTTIAFNVIKMIVSTEDIETMSYQLARINSVIPAECCETNILVDEASFTAEVENLNAEVENLKAELERITTNKATFVVDSNEALAKWANNDTSNGEDYTNVLIKEGTWTSSVGVNLTTTGTKVVVGEAGNKLVFNEVKYGLFYEVLPTTPDYYMNDVNVSASLTDGTVNEDTMTSFCCGFYNCCNLTNCVSETTGGGLVYEGVLTSIGLTIAFYKCQNLTNCIGEGINNNDNTVAAGEDTVYGFYDCFYLDNCSGAGYFLDKFLTETNQFYNLLGVGFRDCYLVYRCRGHKRSFTDVFYNCYSTRSNGYDVADTANGGFNDLTNPEE